MPFINSTQDPDIPNDYPYLLIFPPDESIIDMEELVQFATRIYSDSDHPEKMREYAFQVLDSQIKMKKLKAFCQYLNDAT